MYHRSLTIFLGLGSVHFALYVLLNYLVSYFMYKPIDRVFTGIGGNMDMAKKRISRLPWYASAWIFLLGNLYVALALLPLYFIPTIFPNPDNFAIEKIPPQLFFYSIIPSLYFVYALFPAFIAYFLINDFILDLKEKVHKEFKILFAIGKKKIGLMLFFVFLLLLCRIKFALACYCFLSFTSLFNIIDISLPSNERLKTSISFTITVSPALAKELLYAAKTFLSIISISSS